MLSRLALAIAISAGLAVEARAQPAPDKGDPFQPLEAALSRIMEVEEEVVPQSALLKGTNKLPRADHGLQLKVTGPAFRDCTPAQMGKLTGLWWQMRADLRSLRKAVNAPGTELPPAYQKAIRAAELALERVADPKIGPAERMVLCEEVAGDFRVKSEYAAANPKSAFESVKVTARSCSGQVEKPGCFVLYALAGLASLPGQGEEFPEATRLTPPDNRATSTKDIPPGKYKMWTRLPGAPNPGSRRSVRVGLDGEKKLVVDLEAP